MNHDYLLVIRSLSPRRLRVFALVVCSVVWCLASFCFFAFQPQGLVAAQEGGKLKPEELLARHLEALGSAEARAAVKNRVVSGSAKVVNQIGGTGSIQGNGMMVSAGSKIRFGMNFNSIDYTGEDLAFDGKRISTGLLPRGKSSNLNLFINGQEVILRDGLIGGTL